MSPSKKPDSARRACRSHVTGRHAAAPLVDVRSADTLLHAPAPPPRSSPSEEATADASVTDSQAALAEWSRLGAELSALGSHRLAVAARAAVAAASGGLGVSAEEAADLAQWFAGVVDEALLRGGLAAGVAIWLVLAGDSQDGPFDARVPRCPAVAAVLLPLDIAGRPAALLDPARQAPAPAVAAFLAGLRAAAAGYVHTALACASPADVLELREIARVEDDALEDYRPWGVDLAEDDPASEALERARAMLTCRRLSPDEVCGGLADWARGLAGTVTEHALPPVFRIGAVAWFARVALQEAL